VQRVVQLGSRVRGELVDEDDPVAVVEVHGGEDLLRRGPPLLGACVGSSRPAGA
jgi:hypothetical protein